MSKNYDVRTIREALEKALQRNNYNNDIKDDVHQALAALSRLEESAGEPVAWYVERVAPGKRDNGARIGPFFNKRQAEDFCDSIHVMRPLYAHPPSPGPVELSDADIERIAQKVWEQCGWDGDVGCSEGTLLMSAIHHITKHYTLYPKQLPVTR